MQIFEDQDDADRDADSRGLDPSRIHTLNIEKCWPVVKKNVVSK